ncbi:hypothetical protein QN362_14305 [Actimicrobium sp. CCC2.4]|uniref:hypothetical protein n=1 Tax=Actimicrobium sp. CCC2.4 TaxID=3048606 RepID=UPI002AC9DC51|nr:hypothetical protein [Actimicrobium sp. CCC2.4]MEB0136509.1 hypothetical protein [Actimicrobium sp. CCC2.4]WPX30870.1 hypothetical protein RHM62_11395 [Actimicrobium sp. CCC2.4]
MMYRVVFESQHPLDKRLIIERGPWLVDRASADHWKTYFSKLLPHQCIWIESGQQGAGLHQNS